MCIGKIRHILGKTRHLYGKYAPSVGNLRQEAFE
jgi:hypothetical protein